METVTGASLLKPVICPRPYKIHPLTAVVLLSKPGIVFAEALAGFAGMLLATAQLPNLPAVMGGIICIVLAASGAAMANSVLDRKRDILMPRLARRCQAFESLGRSRITAYSAVMIASSLLVAASRLNMLSMLLLMTAVASYLFLYTSWLKPASHWGIWAGAIPGALPPVIASASVTGTVSHSSLLLAAVIFVWQFPHFLFLALQYRDEYRQAGIPVLPAAKGERVTKLLIMTSLAALLPLTLAFWFLGCCSGGYAIITIFSWTAFVAVSCTCLFQQRIFKMGYVASIAYLFVIISVIILERYGKLLLNP